MTKMLKPLYKHYARLDALERYRLFARAKARDDEEEIDRLFNTCPFEEGAYRVPDRNFIRFYERSQHLCAVFTQWFTEALYKVALLTLQLDCYMSLDIAHTRAFVTEFLEGYDRVLEEKQDTTTITDEAVEAFKDNSLGIGEPNRWKAKCETIKERIGELKAMYGALRKFCDEAGLEMSDILCWNAEIKRTIMRAKGFFETPVAADEKFLDALHRGFRSVWTDNPKEYPDPFTEEELERYGREVKQGTEGYDVIDIYPSNDQVDAPERN
jgi:hypothetical protein